MTLLEVSSLTNCQSCYDYFNYDIDRDEINSILNLVRQRYSKFFADLLTDMLIDSEEQRPCFETIHAFLMPYKDDINNQNCPQYERVVSRSPMTNRQVQGHHHPLDHSPMRQITNRVVNQQSERQHYQYVSKMF